MSLSSAFHMTSVCQIPQVAQTKRHFTYLKYIMQTQTGLPSLWCSPVFEHKFSLQLYPNNHKELPLLSCRFHWKIYQSRFGFAWAGDSAKSQEYYHKQRKQGYCSAEEVCIRVFFLYLYKNIHNTFSSLIDAVIFCVPIKYHTFISLYLLYCSGREELLVLKKKTANLIFTFSPNHQW